MFLCMNYAYIKPDQINQTTQSGQNCKLPLGNLIFQLILPNIKLPFSASCSCGHFRDVTPERAAPEWRYLLYLEALHAEIILEWRRVPNPTDRLKSQRHRSLVRAVTVFIHVRMLAVIIRDG